MPKDDRGVELEAGGGRFFGTIEPVELFEDEEGPDLVICGASCMTISRFSSLGADAAKEGMEVGLFADAVGVEEDVLAADETVLNSAGRCRACTSVIRRACLA